MASKATINLEINPTGSSCIKEESGFGQSTQHQRMSMQPPASLPISTVKRASSIGRTQDDFQCTLPQGIQKKESPQKQFSDTNTNKHSNPIFETFDRQVE